MNQADVRKTFEDSLYEDYTKEQYALLVAKKTDQMNLVKRQEFYTMRPDGHYKLDPINYAWRGYQLGVRDLADTLANMPPTEEETARQIKSINEVLDAIK